MTAGAIPIWQAFTVLSRRRVRSADGVQPLAYRDIIAAAERCVCDLPARDIEHLITQLDDAFLDWAVRDAGNYTDRSID